MQVDVLGPLRVRADDREIDLGGQRSRALVARLALDAGRPVSASSLIDDLWGADVPADATNALQSVVSRTRRRLPDGVLEHTAAGYVLQCSVDAADAERLIASGRVVEALALWRGRPLADVADLPFAGPAAQRLDELRLAALESSLRARAATGGDATVVAELADLTAAHPYRDGFWQLYLTALADHGRGNEALTAYEGLRALLADELGADPSPALQEVHLAILRGEHGPRRAAPRLPAGLTSFVGREGAIADLQSALEDHRLVTILGPGGAGKTRLAVETARATLERFEDVWVAELAPVTGDDGVVPAILSAMGLLEVAVMERPTATHRLDERARLIDKARDVEGLLLIDNCEHLVDAVARITEDVLANAPKLRVVATSREPLRIIGEYAYQLSPLTSPTEDASPEEAMGHSAVELFVLRAQAVDQTFVLDSGTLPAVREICTRLDGQPLAIELAAARLRTLTASQVAARLSDRFRLLTGGSRTALPRHRTLRAVVEWSWDLLEDDERDLTERLAVFPGGVTAASARAVAVGAGDVEQLLDSLADKSLLVPVRGDVPRFRMLETLREYGVERLLDRGVAETVRAAHLGFFLDLAETQSVLLRGPGQLEAVRAIDADLGNVMAALRFAVDRRDRMTAGRMVAALGWYWSIRSQHMEAFTWAEVVLALDGETDPASEIRLQALSATGLLVRTGFDTTQEAWRVPVDRMLALWDEHRPDDPVVHLILMTMEFFEVTGDRVLEEPKDPWTRAMTTLMRAVLLDNNGRVGETGPLIDSAVEAFRGNGDRWGLGMALMQRGMLESLDGEVERALASTAEAVPLLVELGALEDVEYSAIRTVGLRLAFADERALAAMRPEIEAALTAALRSGSQRRELVARMNLASLEHAAGHDDRSIEQLEHVVTNLDSASEFGSGQMEAAIRAALAMGHACRGDLRSARTELAEACRVGRRSMDMPIMADVSVATAAVARLEGDDERAARVLGASEVLRGSADRSNRDVRHLVAALTQSLGAQRYEELRTEGAALDRDRAVELALPV